MPTIAISGRLRSSGGFNAATIASDSSFATGGAMAASVPDGSHKIHPALTTTKNASAPRMEKRAALFMAFLLACGWGRKGPRTTTLLTKNVLARLAERV